LGLLSFLQPKIAWPHSLFWLLLGCGGIFWLISVSFQLPVLTAEQLIQRGIGQIAAQGPSLEGLLICTQCGKKISGQPLTLRDKVYCSERCQIATRTSMEGPRYFLAPPLYAKEMSELLEQALQLAERALRSASIQSVDRPLLLATQRGMGAGAKVEHVANSLDIWGYPQWAVLLRNFPPPEPLPDGTTTGSSRFFDVVRDIQNRLKHSDLQTNPFMILELDRPLDRQDLESLRSQIHTPQQLKAFNYLEQIMKTAEDQLANKTHPRIK
jgi:hypothetical protein